MSKSLSKEQIAETSSTYLQQGRKLESWEITEVIINDDSLTAVVTMTETSASETDNQGFHLTVFSSLEFLSQLMIVYAHDWAGIDAKVREGWMVESSIKCLGSLRGDEFVVEMDILKMRKRGPNLYCHANFTITETSKPDGDKFVATLKGFLS